MTTLGVALALGLVAFASRGSTPARAPGVRRPSDTLLDLAFTLYVVLLVLGFVLLIVLFVLGRHVRMLTGASPRRSALRTLLVLVVLCAGLYVVVQRLELRPGSLDLRELREPPVVGDEGAGGGRSEPYEADFAWIPVLALAFLALVASLAWWRAGKARRRARMREDTPTLAEELADVLAETLESLRAEPDPRRAVIAAYARLERLAAASGVPRRPAEAPVEFLRRLLAGLEVSPPAARRLTTLFERARFSQHEVDATMKLEAIAALEAVQDDLHQAELRARAAREEAHRRLAELARGRASA